MEAWRHELDALKAAGMYRSLRTIDGPQETRVRVDGRELLLLCSNNYLGLASHPALVEAACRATARYGAGSGASRLVSGSMRPHAQLEEALAAFKGCEAALLFNSGYAANTGILQGLFGPDDVIFSDALNHASLIDGCRLSRARTVVYPHADTAALEALLAAEAPHRKGRWLIVSDGVFSMDGDLAPLPELVRLKKRYDALLMIDDAHGTGVLGAGGRGHRRTVRLPGGGRSAHGDPRQGPRLQRRLPGRPAPGDRDPHQPQPALHLLHQPAAGGPGRGAGGAGDRRRRRGRGPAPAAGREPPAFQRAAGGCRSATCSAAPPRSYRS